MISVTNTKGIPRWKVLKSELLEEHFPTFQKSYRSLQSYDLIKVLVDGNDYPITKKENESSVSSYMIFTEDHLAGRIHRPLSWEEAQGGIVPEAYAGELRLKNMMLGELIHTLRSESKPAAIKVNPILVEMGNEGALYLSEEVLIAPIYDEVTKKLLISDPAEARALMAINCDDMERFGIEFVFYMINDRALPDEKEERQNILKNKIEEMAFVIPRVPIKKGSGSFLGILLNLENELEEIAFIRDYQTFDAYSDPIFVTSSLKMLTGKLQEVHYNGERIDTIFMPLIQWQNRKNLPLS